MAEQVQTLLHLHLSEMLRGYREASHRAMEALTADDLDGFNEANRQKRAIHDEWRAVLENYFENHVRRNLNWRAYGAHAKRQRSATQRSCPHGHSALSRASCRHDGPADARHCPRGVERRERTADDHPA